MTRPYTRGASRLVMTAVRYYSRSTEIAEQCGLTARSTKKILLQMWKDGWVTRTALPSNQGYEYARKTRSLT